MEGALLDERRNILDYLIVTNFSIEADVIEEEGADHDEEDIKRGGE